eukprot:COSAG06_NODE_57265_length_281_cov_0.571429_1_plen_44_part_10
MSVADSLEATDGQSALTISGNVSSTVGEQTSIVYAWVPMSEGSV